MSCHKLRLIIIYVIKCLLHCRRWLLKISTWGYLIILLISWNRIRFLILRVGWVITCWSLEGKRWASQRGWGILYFRKIRICSFGWKVMTTSGWKGWFIPSSSTSTNDQRTHPKPPHAIQATYYPPQNPQTHNRTSSYGWTTSTFMNKPHNFSATWNSSLNISNIATKTYKTSQSS